MSAVTNTPINRNFLSPLNFRLVIQKAPTVNFFLQGASIPGLNFYGNASMPTPLNNIPIPGDHLLYTPLTVSFAVDEDLTNYLEIFDWMHDISTSQTLEPGVPYYPETAIDVNVASKIRSDIKLIVLTSSKNPNIEVNFTDAFPTQLGELNFSTTGTDVTYLESSVTFEYIKYTINLI
jgi:hypothetical protein